MNSKKKSIFSIVSNKWTYHYLKEILPMDRALTDTSLPYQSEPESNGNE